MTAVANAVDKKLLKQYKLSIGQRIPMIVMSFVLLQAATAVASAIYFLTTQVKWQTGYGDHTTTIWYAKNWWDGLPVHFDNQFGVHWFASGQHIPDWWVSARHDTRKVMIGFLTALMVGAVTIPVGVRKRLQTWKMVGSVPVALVAALATAGGMIAFFNYVTPFMLSFGTRTNNTFVQNLIGKGTLELLLIGFIAGTVAKRILRPSMGTIQLMSLERNIAQGAEPKWWWKIVYPPNYRNEYRYLVDTGHECEPHNPLLGFVLSFGSPIFVLLLGIGVWLLYFGPAAHAH